MRRTRLLILLAAFLGAVSAGAQTPSTALLVLNKEDASLLRPHGTAVAGGMVFFTSQSEKTIGRYDPVSHEIAPVFRTGQDGWNETVIGRCVGPDLIDRAASAVSA